MEIVAVVALFALAFAALLLSLRALAVTGVPVRASSSEAVEAALDLLALADGESFCDLGCGTGGTLRAARRRAWVRAIGYELNPFAFTLAALRNLFDLGTRVRLRDFRRARLDRIDAVYAYLMPRAMPEVGDLLEAELRPGARFVSVDFPVPGWKPKAVREVGPLRQPIYLYVLGENRG
jgi:SAM-dependent methyltransferase